MLLLGSTRIRTTAYHPRANGMVERFHCQLKASLKSCPPTIRWTDSLPLILLGIRVALKQDLDCSTAELVYGTTLRVPGEFFTPACDKELEDPTSYVTQLRSTMRQLQPVPFALGTPTFTSMMTCCLAHMSSYAMMGCVHLCSPHTMDPLKSSRGLKSSILWTLMDVRTLYR